MIQTRDYQEAAIEALFRYLDTNEGNPIVALPTGTGKSVVIAEFVRRALDRYPWLRVASLTHVKELIEQNVKTLLRLWPSAPVGVYSAGLNRKEAQFPITFAGIASAVNAAQEFGFVHIVLIDEAHLVSPKEGTMYQAFLGTLRTINPALRVIGFTATHYRLGQGLLTEAGGLFTDTCFDLTERESFNWLLNQGYLAPLVPKRTVSELDVENVRTSGGEFVQKDLQQAVDQQRVTQPILEETIKLAANRSHWLVFASGINHALHIRDMLESLGVPATCVHSKMTTSERDRNIAEFKAGHYAAMVNNGILTTGFDFPAIDLIVMLRPTQSPSLWVQMLGRGTRPVYAPGYDLSTKEGRVAAIQAGPKLNCLVLDFAGNTRRLGPINDPVIPQKKGKKRGAPPPVKCCEVCGTYNHASVRFCTFCQGEFPKHIKIRAGASTEDLIAKSSNEPLRDLPVVETLQVDRVTYNRHQKQGRPTTLKVSYFCGLRLFNEWICIEHEGLPRKKARDWWRDRTQGLAPLAPPETIDEVFDRLNELRTPKRIRVWLNTKFPQVLGYEYT